MNDDELSDVEIRCRIDGEEQWVSFEILAKHFAYEMMRHQNRMQREMDRRGIRR